MKINVIVLMLLALIISGCGSTGYNLKNKNNDAKLEVIANVAHQQSIALDKTNIASAKSYNVNIIDVVGVKPTNITKTNFDADIQLVKKNEYQANVTLEQELASTKAQLKEYKSWFGLKGLWLSLKQFSRDIMYSTLGLTLLFVLLRVFAGASPIIGAIWNVIAGIFGWCINQIALLIPGTLDKVKNTEQEIVGVWKSLFGKIIGLFKKKTIVSTDAKQS